MKKRKQVLDLENDTIDRVEETQVQDSKNDNPVIGMLFDSEEAAYNFYNAYGRRVGFSVRKGTTRLDKDKKLIARKFFCSKEGETKGKKDIGQFGQQNYKSTKRCNCNAKLEIKRVEEGQRRVVKFEQEHNHEVVTPTKSHMLRSQKKIGMEVVNLGTRLNSCGVNPSKIYSILANEAEGYENVPFIEVDVRRKIREFSQRTYGKDANAILEYFEKKQEENQSFFYSIQVSETGQMGNCFWVDAKCRVDYQHFGDVVVFDTTYKTEKYLMPFAPFTGVNNHRQSILFGCAMLVDECEASFEWLFRKWLEAMGFPPIAIITDQDSAMTKAIAIVFPNTCHRYCVWHIFQKISEKIPRKCQLIGPFDVEFSRCVDKSLTPEEFERTWEQLIKIFELVDVNWLCYLYSIREMWAPVYFKQIFFAGMSTTQRNESMNKYFKGFVDKNTSLSKFVIQYEKALDYRRQKEKRQDFATIDDMVVCKGPSLLEKTMSEIFTKKVFKIFQVELWESQAIMIKLLLIDGTISEYKVFSDKEGETAYIVTYDSSNEKIECPCRKFEFEGIVCRHIFAVISKTWTKLPPQYVLKRWTRYANSGVVNHMESVMNKSVVLRYNDLCSLTSQIATKGSMTDGSYELARKILLKCIEDLDHHNKEVVDTDKEQVIPRSGYATKICEMSESNEIANSSNLLSLKDSDSVHLKGSGKRIQSACEENWSKGSKPERQCHNCYKYGHDARICPHPKKDKKRATSNIEGK